MSLIVRKMNNADAQHVVELVRRLAVHIGEKNPPRVTPEDLIAHRDLVDVVIAEDDGALVGACLSLMTYSTWRGAKGLYIVDLFVEEAQRGRNVGLLLLKEAARRGQAHGAKFIKLEVDHLNERAARFYERLGFVRKDEDRLFILEHDRLTAFIT